MRSETPRSTLAFNEHKDQVYKRVRITWQMVTSKHDGAGGEQTQIWERSKNEGEGQRLVIRAMGEKGV